VDGAVEVAQDAMEIFPSADTYASVEDIFTPFDGNTGIPTDSFFELVHGTEHHRSRAPRQHQQQQQPMRRVRFNTIQTPTRAPNNGTGAYYKHIGYDRVSEVRDGAPDPLSVPTTSSSSSSSSTGGSGVTRNVTKVGDIATYIFIVAPGLFCAMILTQAYTVWPSDIVFFLVAVLAAIIFYYITHIVYVITRYHTNRDWTDGQIRICNFISGTLLLVPIYYVVRMIVTLVSLPDITPEQIFLVVAAFVVASAYLTTILARGDD
jgi:hypothetical protein